MNDKTPNNVTGNALNEEKREKIGSLPQLDIIELIQMIVDVASGNKSPLVAAQEFSKPFQLAAAVFVKDKAVEYIEHGMSAIGLPQQERSIYGCPS